MTDRLDVLKAAEAKHHDALRKTQQALHKAQQARKQEETRRHQARWQHLGQCMEEVLQFHALVVLTPAQIFDIWELVGRFFREPAACDIAVELLKIRAQIAPEKV